MQSGTQKSSQIQRVGGGKCKVELVSGRRPECLGKKKALIGLEHHELCDPSHRSERNCVAVPHRKEILPSPEAPPHCSRARRFLTLAPSTSSPGFEPGAAPPPNVRDQPRAEAQASPAFRQTRAPRS